MKKLKTMEEKTTKSRTKTNKPYNTGITLIALVVTIVVLLILAGITINAILSEGGILNTAKRAQKVQEEASVRERVQVMLADANLKKLTENKSLSEYLGEEAYTIKTETDESITITEDGYDITIDKETYQIEEIAKSGEDNPPTEIAQNGEWTGTVNAPKIDGTGLDGVYWTGSEWAKLTEESTEEQWNNWYNYADTSESGAGTSIWANAESKDGSMWVWIPRYEYKIDSTNKTIDVNFISVDQTTPTTSDYTIHPAFTTEIENGGWNKELPGFWVAKYEAGYQNGTIGEIEENYEVQYSPTLKYTTRDSAYNYYGEITVNTTSISYPVFKANTYSYNLISVGDAFLLSQEVDTAEMYGLSNVDSHLIKNSEWGAVAYLAHSKYGVNGNSTNMNEVEINNKNLSNSIYANNDEEAGIKANIYAVTSYGDTSTTDTPNNINASTNKNMSGVFDMSGGLEEYTASYYQSSSDDTFSVGMATEETANSTEYVTLYGDEGKAGDATTETFEWNDDHSEFVVRGESVYVRGDSLYDGEYAGIFASNSNFGEPLDYSGFRVCLAF